MIQATLRASNIPWYQTAALAAGLTMAGGAFASPDDVPSTTPEGITLIEVVRELEYAQPEMLWLRPGDAQGQTLFTQKPDEGGVSDCTAECAAEFPPLVAPGDAEASGDWSILQRQDGTRQWVYQSQPLHTWSKEQVPGEVATNVGLKETANSKLAQVATEAGDLLPPDGWKVVRFTPAATRTLPVGIEIRLVYAAQAVALTDAEGHTLYVFDGSGGEACATDACGRQWDSVVAPAIAKGVGDFTVVARPDGTNQWAYKQQPLFTYDGDKLPGDAHGAGLREEFQVAMLTKSFRPAGVGVTFLEGYGAALATNGMTLYGGYPFEKRWGGRNLRDTFRNAYYKGKRLGGAACAETGCLDTWRPFRASAYARPRGFWEPLERKDGTRQWAYKGYAMYTYAGDDAPGEHYGQAIYDFEFEGDGYDFERVAFLQDIANGTMKRANTNGGVGIYWNIAKP